MYPRRSKGTARRNRASAALCRTEKSRRSARRRSTVMSRVSAKWRYRPRADRTWPSMAKPLVRPCACRVAWSSRSTSANGSPRPVLSWSTRQMRSRWGRVRPSMRTRRSSPWSKRSAAGPPSLMKLAPCTVLSAVPTGSAFGLTCTEVYTSSPFSGETPLTASSCRIPLLESPVSSLKRAVSARASMVVSAGKPKLSQNSLSSSVTGGRASDLSCAGDMVVQSASASRISARPAASPMKFG